MCISMFSLNIQSIGRFQHSTNRKSMHQSRIIVIVSACLALIVLTSALTLAVVSGGQNVQTVQTAQNGSNVSYRAGSVTRRLSGSDTGTGQVVADVVSPAATAVFPVTFTESGLPSGSTWNVTLNGVTDSGSAGSAITFSEPNGTYAYTLTGPYGYQLVSPGATGTVTVAGNPNTVVGQGIAVGTGPDGIAYDSSNGYLYVTNANSNNVTAIDGTSNTVVVHSITVGSSPVGIAYDPSNGYLYVTNSVSHNVTVINGATNTVVSSIPMGTSSIGHSFGPAGIAYDPSNGYLYVTNHVSGSNNVTAINGATNTVVVPSIGVGAEPLGIAYNPSNGFLYVTNQNSGNVTAINGATNTVVVPNITVGSQPYGIAYDPSNGYLYVTNQNSGNVTVINGTTNTVVVSAIAVGSDPQGITYDPSNGYLYAANLASNNVTVINGPSNTVAVPGIPVGSEPQYIAYDASNGYLYVTNLNSNSVTVINGNGLLATAWKVAPRYPVTFTESGLPSGSTWNVTLHGVTKSGLAGSAITFSEPNGTYAYTLTGPSGYRLVSPGATGTVTVAGNPNTIEVPGIAVGTYPYYIAYDASNRYLYVTNYVSNSVTVINGTTNNVVVSAIAVGSFPIGIAYDPSNGYLYVVNSVSNSVTVINGATNTVVVPSIGVGISPYGIAYDSSNGCLYVTNQNSNNVTAINGTSNTVAVPGIPVGSGPAGIAYDPSNGCLYVTNVGSGSVTVINGTTNTVVVPSIGVGISPYGIAYDSSNGYLYVVSSVSNNVTAINGTSNTVAVPGIPVGSGPAGIAFDPSNGYLYVANDGSGNVTVINGTSNTVAVPGIAVGSEPNGIAYDPSNGYLYVANSNSNNVTVINGNGLLITSWKPPPRYPVTFTETGLPSGTEWWVNVTGQPSQVSTRTTITVDLVNGSYTYTVSTVDKTYNASGGTFAVNGVADNESVTFSLVTYTVTFTETGLPSGTEWWVNLTSGSSFSSTGSTRTFSEPNGTYSYSIATVNKSWSSNGGSFTVNGAPASKSVTFTEVTYTVTLTETGLPSGTSWSVTLDGVAKASTAPTLTFTEPNGTYTYTVSTPISGGTGIRYVTVGSGSVTVSGNNTSVSVPYTTQYYLTMSSNPSSGGTASPPSGWYNASSSVTISATPVSGYAFISWTGAGTGSYTGTSASHPITMGAPITESANFGKLYAVTLTETGLPSGTEWFVNLTNGQSFHSTTSAITFNEPNGTYSYSIATVNKSWSSNGGSFTVNGAPVSQSVTFTEVTYTVTLTETGLPSGTNWSAALAGLTKYSASSTITFTEPNGTYAYSIGSIPGYSSSPSTGTLTVSGASQPVSVSFTQVTYAVTFTESGLPSGTTWYVNITGRPSLSSTTSTITTTLPNGTYSYSAATTDKIYSSSGSSLTVNGASVSKSVAFTEVTYTVTLTETGLSSGTNWSVTLAGLTKYSTSTTITFNEPNATYAYTVSNTSYYYTSSYSGTLRISGAAQSENIAYQHYSYITGTVTPSNAVITINGNPVTVTSGNFNVTVTAGTYALAASSSGYITYYSNFTLSAGQTHTLTISLHIRSSVSTSPSKSSSSSTYLYIGIGAAAVIALIAAAVIVSRKRKQT